MNYKLASAILILTFIITPITSQDLASRLDSYLSDCVNQGYAGSILVSEKDQIVLHQGYGLANKESTIHNQPNTIFDIGSNTKQFTGAAVLLLEESNVLSCDDSIDKYFDNIPSDKKDITIHQLLTHSSGLKESLRRDFEKTTTKEFFNQVFSSELIDTPGAAFHYSNIGYSVLARIVELSSGMEFEEFLQKRLFARAGMKETGYLLPDWKENRVAHGYNRGMLHQGSTIARYKENGKVSWHVKGNGGINSTQGDLNKWIKTIKNGKLLSEESIKKWTTPYIKEINNFYGYGWGVYHVDQPVKAVYHNGGNGSFAHTIIWHTDEDRLILFATNYGSPQVETIPYELERIILDSTYTPEKLKKNPYLFVHEYTSAMNSSSAENLLAQLKLEYPDQLSSPEFLNRMGYIYLKMNKTHWALTLFQLNTTLFPDHGNVWDSLGEAQMIAKDSYSATLSYIKALELGIDDSCSWCHGSILKLKELLESP